MALARTRVRARVPRRPWPRGGKPADPIRSRQASSWRSGQLSGRRDCSLLGQWPGQVAFRRRRAPRRRHCRATGHGSTQRIGAGVRKSWRPVCWAAAPQGLEGGSPKGGRLCFTPEQCRCVASECSDRAAISAAVSAVRCRVMRECVERRTGTCTHCAPSETCATKCSAAGFGDRRIVWRWDGHRAVLSVRPTGQGGGGVMRAKKRLCT